MAVSFIRTIIILIVLMLSQRFMGKRQIGELEPTELIIAVLISNLAAQPLQDTGTPLLYGLIPVLTLLCCQVLISALTVKSSRFRSFICGKPSILIKNGVINQREMQKNRIAVDELGVELRLVGITDISGVKYAVLETNGKLSVLPFSGHSPVTPSQLGIETKDGGIPVTIISEGRVISDNLRLIGRDEGWLKEELAKNGAISPGEVYLMTVDETGKIYYAGKIKK